ncbi:hypothetical protein BDZ89DRAFT_838407 [Hymenopellis radicata]|nr:hypothetical protein BDZ89DRAFT_838407 [Hymenopellis radicata]
MQHIPVLLEVMPEDALDCQSSSCVQLFPAISHCQGGVQTETGFLTPKETAYLSATVHDLVRRGNYLIHQPAWILTVDASKLVLDVKYGPPDDAWKDSVGRRFSTDQNVMNSRGIIVFLLLPHGGLHPHFECCALLTPEWIRNPTATYLPELTHLLGN